ncbi:hypothetical protein FH972_020255 [Carpinus fangiana]|uniref:Bulb-type lectin domain-containing protein n=1 Tax=Carpinus fangiana TaxID=176857 RepID=A0A5N6RSQ6_9ROSI|nr:hypothetical protein FH972_020255 [Carpinus fangiana]
MKGSQQYWSSPLIDHLADIFVIDGDYLTWPSTNEIRRIRLDIYENLLLQTYSDYWFSFCLHYNNNISCTTTDTIRAGQSLNTSKTIVSAKGREYSEYYMLGIRYYNVPGDNVVFVADSFLNSSAFLTLDSDGNLLTSDGNLTNISDAKTGWSLTSRGSYASPYPGGFSLQYLASRKELILLEESEAYWSSTGVVHSVVF